MSMEVSFKIAPTTLNEKELGDRIVQAIDAILAEHVEGYGAGSFSFGGSSTRFVWSCRGADGVEKHTVTLPEYKAAAFVHVDGASIPPLEVVNPGKVEADDPA